MGKMNQFDLLQFRDRTSWRKLGLFNGNRFGEYFYNDNKAWGVEDAKKHSETYLKTKSSYTGVPNLTLQRQEGYLWADAKTLDKPNYPQKRGGEVTAPAKAAAEEVASATEAVTVHAEATRETPGALPGATAGGGRNKGGFRGRGGSNQNQ